MTVNLAKYRTQVQISFFLALGRYCSIIFVHLVLQLNSLLQVDFQLLQYDVNPGFRQSRINMGYRIPSAKPDAEDVTEVRHRSEMVGEQKITRVVGNPQGDRRSLGPGNRKTD